MNILVVPEEFGVNLPGWVPSAGDRSQWPGPAIRQRRLCPVMGGPPLSPRDNPIRERGEESEVCLGF